MEAKRGAIGIGYWFSVTVVISISGQICEHSVSPFRCMHTQREIPRFLRLQRALISGCTSGRRVRERRQKSHIMIYGYVSFIDFKLVNVFIFSRCPIPDRSDMNLCRLSWHDLSTSLWSSPLLLWWSFSRVELTSRVVLQNKAAAV